MRAQVAGGGQTRRPAGPARGRRAEPAQQDPPGAVRFEADHLLLQDGGHEGLEDPRGPAHPQPRVTEHQLADDRVPGGESGQVVLRAELSGEGVQQPRGARAPRLAGDQGAVARGAAGDAQGARAVGGQRRAPDGAGVLDGKGGIAAAAPVHGQDEPDIEAEGGQPLTAHPGVGAAGCVGAAGLARRGY